MRNLSFVVSRADARQIQIIAERMLLLLRRAGADVTLQDCLMDITATHANGCPLHLQALAGAADFDFAHDVSGIRRHLDRTTGQLGGCFVPRYAKAQSRS